MRGLLGRDGLPEGEVYVFPRCNAIHTVGMRFAIDVVFLDAEGCVLSIHPNVPPERWMVAGGRHARTAVEAAAGWLPPHLSVGSPLPFSPGNGPAWPPCGPTAPCGRFSAHGTDSP